MLPNFGGTNSTKEGETMSFSLSHKFVSACCPHLTQHEVIVLYNHIYDTWPSLDSCYPNDVITVARQLFPDVQEAMPEKTPPISPEDLAKVNRFRIAEAIANLEAAQDWLVKVRSPSDDVAMAVRDTGMIVDRLQGVKQ